MACIHSEYSQSLVLPTVLSQFIHLFEPMSVPEYIISLLLLLFIIWLEDGKRQPEHGWITWLKTVLVLSQSSAVTILKSKSKIAIFCQNRPKSKSLHLLCHVSISSCFDFLQQLMDVTGLKDYNVRRFQTEYCVYTTHGLKIK